MNEKNKYEHLQPSQESQLESAEENDHKEEVQEVLTKTYRLAGFWIRLYAYLFDLIIIGSLTFLFVRPFLSLFRLSTDLFLFSIGMSSLGLIGAIYFSIMTKLWSQSLGKMIFGLKVIKSDGQPLDWLTVLLREIAGRTVSQVVGLHLGYIWVAFHPKKQAWHDQLMDTYVVFDEDGASKQMIKVTVQN